MLILFHFTVSLNFVIYFIMSSIITNDFPFKHHSRLWFTPICCQSLMLKIRLELFTCCFTWQSIESNKLAISTEFHPKSSARLTVWKTSIACTIPFHASQGRSTFRLPIFLCSKSLVLSFQAMKGAPSPLYKLSRALRRKNLCGRYPNCLPTSWTDTGWVNTTGFWLLCLREHGEPPVSNAYVFACFSASRCQISYPWLHTFFRVPPHFALWSTPQWLYRQYPGQYCWAFFPSCCWYWVCFTVSRDADFIRRGVFPPPPFCCCYMYIFCGNVSRRHRDKLQRNFFAKSRSILLFVTYNTAMF